MKIRESGMPQEALWESYFDPSAILSKLGLTQTCGDVVEFGCGYGTFTIAAARRVWGTVHALDIEPQMLQVAAARAESAGLDRIDFVRRDFMRDGSGLGDGATDYAMLFNILHADDPVQLLREALRNVKPAGTVGVMHWNYDRTTPRGPPMEMRPRPDDCRRWAAVAGFECGPIIDLPPYHYGLILSPAGHA